MSRSVPSRQDREVQVTMTWTQFDLLWCCFIRGGMEMWTEWQLDPHTRQDPWPKREIYLGLKEILSKAEMKEGPG